MDTPAGLTEDTRLVFAASDEVLLRLQPDQPLTVRLNAIAAGLRGQTGHFAQLREAAARLKLVAGLLPMDLLAVPASLGGFFRPPLRGSGVSLPGMAAAPRCDLDQARQVGEVLVDQGDRLASSDGDIMGRGETRVRPSPCADSPSGGPI